MQGCGGRSDMQQTCSPQNATAGPGPRAGQVRLFDLAQQVLERHQRQGRGRLRDVAQGRIDHRPGLRLRRQRPVGRRAGLAEGAPEAPTIAITKAIPTASFFKNQMPIQKPITAPAMSARSLSTWLISYRDDPHVAAGCFEQGKRLGHADRRAARVVPVAVSQRGDFPLHGNGLVFHFCLSSRDLAARQSNAVH